MPCDPKLLQKLQSARELPTLPAVLIPLLRHLERRVAGRASDRGSNRQGRIFGGRCLQIANSPLFGTSREVESIQSAVVAMGLERIHQIAVSCSFLKLLPSLKDVSPSVFWAHSLGCAPVAREFAGRIGFPAPGTAYAALMASATDTPKLAKPISPKTQPLLALPRSLPSFNRSILHALPLKPRAPWKKCVPWSRKCMEACSESRQRNYSTGAGADR